MKKYFSTLLVMLMISSICAVCICEGATNPFNSYECVDKYTTIFESRLISKANVSPAYLWGLTDDTRSMFLAFMMLECIAEFGQEVVSVPWINSYVSPTGNGAMIYIDTDSEYDLLEAYFEPENETPYIISMTVLENDGEEAIKEWLVSCGASENMIYKSDPEAVQSAIEKYLGESK